MIGRDAGNKGNIRGEIQTENMNAGNGVRIEILRPWSVRVRPWCASDRLREGLIREKIQHGGNGSKNYDRSSIPSSWSECARTISSGDGMPRTLRLGLRTLNFPTLNLDLSSASIQIRPPYRLFLAHYCLPVDCRSAMMELELPCTR